MTTESTLGETYDTIAAIITPPGQGGVAAVRIAGPLSAEILGRHFRPINPDHTRAIPFVLRVGLFHSGDGTVLDEVTVVFMESGHSYTGLDQVEIFCHGGQVIVKKILETILSARARAAEPGEFTRLAFENGRIDLAKAEAVAEVISAQTEFSYRASREHLFGRYSEHIEVLRQNVIDVLAEIEAGIDFTDDAPEVDGSRADRLRMLDQIIAQVLHLSDTYAGGRIITEGFTVAIAGRPNAGKSSLFNLLLRHERALVTPTPGTTRDYLQERIDLGGYAVNLIDTAGLRRGGGKIERAGQDRALEVISKADLLVWMVDVTSRNWVKTCQADLRPFADKDKILLCNKIDISKRPDKQKAAVPYVEISCRTGVGLGRFVTALQKRIEAKAPDMTFGIVVTSLRHKQKLTESIRHLKSARSKLAKSVSGELIAYDIRKAITALAEITGKVYTEQVLARIFSKFCIGK